MKPTAEKRARDEQTEAFETKSPAGTISLGRKLAKRLCAGDCLAITGSLGAGKTVLVRGIVAGLGIADSRLVSSPTFVLVHEYQARVPVYHIDLYRLGDASVELAELGIDEMLADGIVLIEWADKAGSTLPRRRWELSISITGKSSRRLDLSRIG